MARIKEDESSRKQKRMRAGMRLLARDAALAADSVRELIGSLAELQDLLAFGVMEAIPMPPGFEEEDGYYEDAEE
jgi:hypothetical protein